MIVPMKKVTLATLASSASRDLESLRDLGILHVTPLEEEDSLEDSNPQDRVEWVRKALDVLPGSEEAEERAPSGASPLQIAERTVAAAELKEKYEKRLQELEIEIARWDFLGDDGLSDIQFLRDNGLSVRLYRTNESLWKKTNLPFPHLVVNRDSGIQYVLVVSDTDEDVPLEKMPLPDMGSEELQEEADAVREAISSLDEKLQRYAGYRDKLIQALPDLEDQLEAYRVRSGMGTADPLAYIQGYCPVDALETLQNRAQEQGWGLLVQEPDAPEEVPTYVKNPPWIRIIDPVLRFMGTIPGYKEFDVSFWFLLSLTLFFAMLVGDGGYGLLFLAVAVIVRWRSDWLTGEAFALICVFSGATILWGLLTGTWFGVESLTRIPILGDAVIPGLNSYAQNDEFMIQLCFVIGAFHLSLAHLLRGVRFLSSLRALGEAGWIIIIWALYLLAGYFVLGKPLPGYTPYVVAAGILMAGIFSGRGGGFFRSVLLGVVDLPFAFIRSFSDMVSYIRLFAVGYATVVVAVSFNEMAAGVASDSRVGAVGAAAVLLFGHVLNMLLALMAVLVHGIRLNVLEFSTHLNMGWTGIPYRPFKSHRENEENSRRGRNGL